MANEPNTVQRMAPWLLLLLLGWFGVSAVARPLLRPYEYSDFATFYSAAEAFRHGTDPYELESLQATGSDDFSGWIGRYLYPPPFAAVVVQPLTSLPFPVARRVWVVIETLAYLAALLWLAALVFGRLDRRSLLLTGLVGLPWAPFQLDLRLGSVSGVLLLLLVGGLWFLRQRHDARAGVFLGAAALLKVSPTLLLVLLWLRGHHRVVLGAVVGVVAAIAVSLPFTGMQSWKDFVAHVVPVLSGGNFSWFTNQSIDALFWRLFMDNPDTSAWVVSTTLYRVGALSLSLVILAATVWLAWRDRARPRADMALLWLAAVGLVTALLLARVTWEYMTVLAVPSFVLWLRHLIESGASRRAWWLFLIAWILCAAPFPYSREPIREGIGLLLMSPRLAGMLLAFAVTGHLLRTRQVQLDDD